MTWLTHKSKLIVQSILEASNQGYKGYQHLDRSIVYCGLSIVDCLLWIVYCGLSIVDCLLWIVYCVLSIVDCLLWIVYCFFSIVYCLLCIFNFLLTIICCRFSIIRNLWKNNTMHWLRNIYWIESLYHFILKINYNAETGYFETLIEKFNGEIIENSKFLK